MFYERFEKLCRERGYTPSGAVLAIGRSRNLAAKWKSTNATPSAEVMHELSKFFGVSIDYLLCKTDDPGNDSITARQEAFERADLRILLDAAKDVPPSKVYEVVALLERFKEESKNDS